jgi:hypothetical protein
LVGNIVEFVEFVEFKMLPKSGKLSYTQ